MRNQWTAAVVFAVVVGTAAGWSAAAEDEGFTSLFNGKDLTGWVMKEGGAALDGATETKNKRFQVVDGRIVVDAKAKGNMILDTAKLFDKDVDIQFEFLPGPNCNNDLYLRGAKFDLKKGTVKNLTEGEWHKLEIVVRGEQIEFKCNGETQQTFKAKAPSSPLGVRAEFGVIEFRNLRFKEKG